MSDNGTVLDTPLVNAEVVGVEYVPPGEEPAPEPTPEPPTGVVAGTPGYFTPEGSQVPATIGDLRALGIGSGPAWTEGQYVVIGSGNVYWTGTDWAMGVAPAAEPET